MRACRRWRCARRGGAAVRAARSRRGLAEVGVAAGERATHAVAGAGALRQQHDHRQRAGERALPALDLAAQRQAVEFAVRTELGGDEHEVERCVGQPRQRLRAVADALRCQPECLKVLFERVRCGVVGVDQQCLGQPRRRVHHRVGRRFVERHGRRVPGAALRTPGFVADGRCVDAAGARHGTLRARRPRRRRGQRLRIVQRGERVELAQHVQRVDRAHRPRRGARRRVCADEHRLAQPVAPGQFVDHLGPVGVGDDEVGHLQRGHLFVDRAAFGAEAEVRAERAALEPAEPPQSHPVPCAHALPSRHGASSAAAPVVSMPRRPACRGYHRRPLCATAARHARHQHP